MGRGKVVSSSKKYSDEIDDKEKKNSFPQPVFWVCYCSTVLDPSDLLGHFDCWYPCYDTYPTNPDGTPVIPETPPAPCNSTTAATNKVSFIFERNYRDPHYPVSVTGVKVI